MVTKEKFDTVFHGDIIGKEIIFLESTTSTNDVAMKTGRKRENPEGIVVIADSQTHGKGRLGREWVSPPGVNLYFTVLLRPPFPPGEASILTLTAAVAVVSAIRNYTGVNAGIKWPNDILVNGKKAGGILLEMKAAKNRINLLAAGIGLNVNMPLYELPEDITSLSTSLKMETGESVDRVRLFGKILAEIENTYKILLNGNKRALINEWIRLNSTLTKKVTVKSPDKIISGLAENINDNGELIIRLPDGKTETVNAGDVTIVKG
ncbi:MAG: biotin--[acetyl-CoA-carboxylase] ligase [Nitrospirae bacterium]|nr:biotin--[acetyl-CoA-carboxylase] ligase [Nitrospirota bacterium]